MFFYFDSTNPPSQNVHYLPSIQSHKRGKRKVIVVITSYVRVVIINYWLKGKERNIMRCSTN